jgi:hypothetical protein
MAFSPAFTVGQSASDPSAVTFEDTSTGSDAAIASRRIYVTDSNGDAVVPSGTSTAYIAWALGTNPKTVADLLTEDIAATITIQWLNSANTVLYSSTDTFCLREYNIVQFISLIQDQALTPGVVQDSNYFSNLCQYWINIVGADTMITDASDLSGSQNCLNRATQMLDNETFYF